jgi:uncharacterized membrane protein YdjX (TVP38/TMEM64 family)
MMAGGIAGFVLAGFLAVQWFGVEWLKDPTEHMQQGKVWAALIGGGLLLADVFLPVPSSIVMIAHGAILGIGIGFLISWIASIGGAMLGWWVGANCKAWVSRKISEADQARALRWFDRYGLTSIVLSRLFPIVSETVSVMAGLTGMDWQRVLIASALGSLPPALLYAFAGAMAVSSLQGLWIAAGVFALGGLGWWINQSFMRMRWSRSDET